MSLFLSIVLLIVKRLYATRRNRNFLKHRLNSNLIRNLSTDTKIRLLIENRIFTIDRRGLPRILWFGIYFYAYFGVPGIILTPKQREILKTTENGFQNRIPHPKISLNTYHDLFGTILKI